MFKPKGALRYAEGAQAPVIKNILTALRHRNHPNGILNARAIHANYLDQIRPRPLIGEFGQDEGGSTFLFFEKEE
ncbi:MAG: hypothetical protein J5I98_34515 [Phaeodactylibacter sp.]|nr:hypothetical protein [Phaeodactylibacter sp.]